MRFLICLPFHIQLGLKLQKIGTSKIRFKKYKVSSDMPLNIKKFLSYIYVKKKKFSVVGPKRDIF